MSRTRFKVNPHSIVPHSKWLSALLRTKWTWVRVQLQSLKNIIFKLQTPTGGNSWGLKFVAVILRLKHIHDAICFSMLFTEYCLVT